MTMNPYPRAGGSVLRQARHLFLERGEIPAGLVDERLMRSWQRSRGAGLAPMGRAPDEPRLSGSHLRHALERQNDFIAHAQPVMEYLYAQLEASHSMVILADDRGLLVHAMGDPDFLGRAERVALAPGASWHEQQRGTNAIGTALAERAPVEIHGAEHFLERNSFLTCAAAPILDPGGRLLGVLEAMNDLGGEIPVHERPDREAMTDAARHALGDAEFEAARAAGRSLPLEQAVAEALAFVTTP